MRTSSVVSMLVIGFIFSTFIGEACTPFNLGGASAKSDSVGLSTARTSTVTPGGGFVNSTAFWQDPTDVTLFFGRKLLADGANFQLYSFRLDIDAGTLTPIAAVAPTQFAIGDGRTVGSAYDPSVAIINGERVIAFECIGPAGFAGTTASCIGPLDSNNQLITARTAVIVDGIASDPNEPLFFSASVPKLAVDGGVASLIWTQVRETRGGVFQSLKTWGAPIAKGVNGFYWLSGLTSAAASDASPAHEIWGVTQPPMADVSQAIPYSNHYLVAAQAGDASCQLPAPARAGCYYMKLGWASKSLGSGAFDSMMDLDGLPEVAANHIVQYPRFFRDPRGGTSLMFNDVDTPVMTIWRLNLQEPGVVTVVSPTPTPTPVPLTPAQSYATSLFQIILGRAPDSAALASLATSSCYEVGRIVAESSEAFNSHYAVLSNSDFVSLEYMALLGRTADAAGLTNWTNQLDAGAMTRVQVIESVLGSSEYSQRCSSLGL